VSVSTHVLDTARGRPAAGVAVTLSHRKPGGDWSVLGRAMTRDDGRAEVSQEPMQPGEYRLEFSSGEYFNASGTSGFYPEISVVFVAADGDTHLHVPLLLSPFGYSTYKGK
jgi:5-hydroxyisourate hydrolase